MTWRVSPAHMAAHLTTMDVRQTGVGDEEDDWDGAATSTVYKLHPHTKLLSQKFREAALGRSRRQIWALPPRYGKSLLASQWGPAWFLELFPHKRVILASYGHDLALYNARQCRNILRGYRSRLSTQLKQDATAADQWMTEKGGGLKAAGVGGALTGFGADLAICFTGETLVSTPNGPMRIDALTRMGGVVWSYDHAAERVVEAPIRAGRVSPADDLIELTFTSGRRFTCTPEHRIWTETGYQPARLVKVGTEVLGLGGHPLRPLRDDVPAPGLRLREVPAARGDGLLLRPRLPRVGTARELPLSAVLGTGTEGPTPLRLVPRTALSPAPGSEAAQEGVCGLRIVLPAEVEPTGVLRSHLRRFGPLPADAGRGELALQGSQRLHDHLPADATADPRAGRASLHRLPQAESGEGAEASGASLQRGPDGQPAGEPGPALPDVPHHAPQVGRDAVAVVRRLRREGEPVYDLTVEGPSNFFADGVLVHNCDDPLKDWEEAQSENQREKVWAWYRSVLRTRLHKGGAIIVLATRWHLDDLSGRLLAEDDQRELEGRPRIWDYVRLPTVADGEERGIPDALGREDGEVLCEDLFPIHEVMEQREELGPVIFGAMHQQDPTEAAGNLIKREWFRRYDAPPEYQDLQNWAMSVDCAFSDTKESDYVVIQVWARSQFGHYLIDQVRDRMSYVETKDAIFRIWAKWPKVNRVLVEGKANGPAVIAEMAKDIRGLIPINPVGAKEQRVWSITPMLRTGDVWIPTNGLRPWGDAVIDECCAFPYGLHDDQVDAMTQHLLWSEHGGPLSLGRAIYPWSSTIR